LGKGKKGSQLAEKSFLRLNCVFPFLSVSEDIHFCEDIHSQTLTTASLIQFMSRLKSSWTEEDYEKNVTYQCVQWRVSNINTELCFKIKP